MKDIINRDDKFNKEKINGKLVSIFLFQYSLLIPLMTVVSPRSLVIGSGLLLVSVMIFYNSTCKINIDIVFFMALMLIVLLLKSIPANADFIPVAYFISVAGPVAVMFLYPFDYMVFLVTCSRLAIWNFFIICWYPFTGAYEYMRFGYGMLPTVIFIYIKIVYLRKYMAGESKRTLFTDAFILCISTMEMVLYGARGTVFALLLFVFLERFWVNKTSFKWNLLLLTAGGVLYIFIIPIIDLLGKISEYIGINSYVLAKFRMQIMYGFARASSGRDYIYQSAIEKIKEHPVLGNDIRVLDEGNYAHNIFLQTGQDLGMAGLVILTIFLIFVLVKIWSNKTPELEKILLTVLFSISIGRLMFSSTLWVRPEFWMLVCFVLAGKKSKRKGYPFYETLENP